MTPEGRNNWNRWPERSDRGSLNLADGQSLTRGLSSVSRGEVFSLAIPLSPETWTADHRPAPLRFMTRDGGDYAVGAGRPDGFQFAEDTWLLPTHSGTHIDALCHVWYDDEMFDGISSHAVRSTTGAKRLGAEHLAAVATRGILIDVSAAADSAGPAGEIGLEEVQRTLERDGIELASGDAVLIRTGWLGNCDSEHTYYASEPGLGMEAAAWLAESGIALVGADNFAFEVHPRTDGGLFPVHRLLLRDYGIPILENAWLDDLAGAGVSEFLMIASPLPLVGGTAGPVAPLAIV